MNQPLKVQVTIDCEAPHVLADWWAETLDWTVEPQDETFIRSMIEKGFASEADTIVHNGSMVWASATAISAGADATAGQPRILFQQVPEPKTVKNRIHLDLRTGNPDELAALHQRLSDRGAPEVGRGAQGPHHWITFADPEGNEFCVDAAS